ncbi:MAG: metalloregulator ArsR/SmtB family transcription factor [bacterium]|jgi:ArsR family transcriptional regulator
MRHVEKIFKALADRNRLRILKMLEARPLCVCEITAVLGIAQSSVSRHLGILREAGLVDDQKEGQWMIYSLARGGDDVTKSVIAGIGRWLADDPLVKSDSRKAQQVDREQLCPKT